MQCPEPRAEPGLACLTVMALQENTTVGLVLI